MEFPRNIYELIKIYKNDKYHDLGASPQYHVYRKEDNRVFYISGILELKDSFAFRDDNVKIRIEIKSFNNNSTVDIMLADTFSTKYWTSGEYHDLWHKSHRVTNAAPYEIIINDNTSLIFLNKNGDHYLYKDTSKNIVIDLFFNDILDIKENPSKWYEENISNVSEMPVPLDMRK